MDFKLNIQFNGNCNVEFEYGTRYINKFTTLTHKHIHTKYYNVRRVLPGLATACFFCVAEAPGSIPTAIEAALTDERLSNTLLNGGGTGRRINNAMEGVVLASSYELTESTCASSFTVDVAVSIGGLSVAVVPSAKVSHIAEQQRVQASTNHGDATESRDRTWREDAVS